MNMLVSRPSTMLIMPQFARFMCQRGAVMSKVADAFNVSTRTLFNWLNLHPELHDAVQVGVDAFNARVERALAERAIGFFVTIKEEKPFDAQAVFVRGEPGGVAARPRQACDQAGAEPDDVLGIVGEVIVRQRLAQKRPNERSAQDGHEREQ
jgi:hypothetical protein